MTEYIPDDLPLLVTESTRISNNTVELIQTGLASFKFQILIRILNQIHDKYIEG